LASASETTKYAVASIGAGNRPSGTAVIVVATLGLVRACYRHHGPSRIRLGHLDGLAGCVDVSGPVRLSERQLQRRVT
jgi:hypothetical protein